MKITVQRSSEWCQAQALDTGTNVPETIEVEVAPIDLSVEARKMILAAQPAWAISQYPDNWSGYYNENHHWSRCSHYGQLLPLVDSDAPTPEQISSALLVTDASLARRREAAEAERAEREAQAKAAALAWAALPVRERVRDLGGTWGINFCGLQSAEINQYCPEARVVAEQEAKRLTELAAGQRAIQDRQVLAEFLSWFPQDALIGALRAATYNADAEAISALKRRIKAAASPVVVFEDEE
jgi:hypothetical protein